ncbi:MAG: 2,3-dihydroxy-2,3-dihydro-p-cumate dehydrogenase [Pseudonocardiales bacterium]|jgi:2,3-dihydroxy-2,3-dihydro-p-cumate dehydrogenase|nr:2,3-dihydroxy-2,3-dihydro-p-cumate dehydrogenase [Pseudonocardiales bacterium]MDT7774676.1 2,3-dihydroxy-2,3-dihydro-p-cumate dehydrogenase [Pseudonocardiales bacterium]
MRYGAERTAIVTGAAVGIGKAIAARFADEGVRLVIADLDAELIEKTAAGLARDGRPAPVALTGDLSERANADALVAACQEAYGRVDILVNNAGGGVVRPTLTHTEETLRATVDRNLWTTIYCSLAALPVMKAQGYGRIVNMGAESVRNGLYWHAVYNAAKGGVHGLTTGLAREFIGDGITVNTVAPSAIRTEAYDAFNRPEELAMIKKMVDLIPAGRAGTVDEVASMVAYLASDEAGYVTGQVVSVNGGSSML